MASCDNRINCHIQITLRALFTTEKWAPQKRVCKPYKSEAEVQVVQVNKMTGLQNIRSRRALQGQDKQSVVFPWCFDAWGTGGRRRTQLAGGQALLSATHSVTHSAGAINVSKKKKKVQMGRTVGRGVGLRGPDQPVSKVRTAASFTALIQMLQCTFQRHAFSASQLKMQKTKSGIQSKLSLASCFKWGTACRSISHIL